MHVRMTGFESERGNVKVGLVGDEDGWLQQDVYPRHFHVDQQVRIGALPTV